jgi:histidine triad (HIT) family protein
MRECVFCRIVTKKFHARIIHEEKDVLCVLDVHPISRGHCLIMSKKHYEDIFDIDTKVLGKIVAASRLVAKRMKLKLGAEGINLLHASGKAAQQSVPHFHIHLVPRYSGDSLDAWPKSNYKESSLDEVSKIMGF